METNEVIVSLRDQNLANATPPTGAPVAVRGRRLQVDTLLILTFDVVINIRYSGETELDLGRYIGGAFDSLFEQRDYHGDIRATGFPEFEATLFFSISEGTPVVPTPAPATSVEEPLDSETLSTTSIGIITGTVVVVVAAIAMFGLFVFNSRRDAKRSTTQDSPNGAVEIDVHSRIDVSTLGDPIPPGQFEFETTAGVSADGTMSLNYDYKRRGTSLADVSNQSSNPLLFVQNDDDTLGAQYLEETLEVEAPPGMLGLVLEASGDGIPTVHAIKPTSPLAAEVQVGDRLLSVDGEDVTVMLATEVSLLIASKRDNSVRRFVFSRRAGLSPAPDEPLDHPVPSRESSFASRMSPAPDDPLPMRGSPARSFASDELDDDDDSSHIPLPASLMQGADFLPDDDDDSFLQRGPATFSLGESSVDTPDGEFGGSSLEPGGDSDWESIATPAAGPTPSVGESPVTPAVSNPLLSSDDDHDHDYDAEEEEDDPLAILELSSQPSDLDVPTLEPKH